MNFSFHCPAHAGDQRIQPTMSATIRCNSARDSVPPWGVAWRVGLEANPLPRAGDAKIAGLFEIERKLFDEKCMRLFLELYENRAL
ncbi:hypothetical protein [Novosphingobium sp. Fuku2-ISO-50]|uniref:hypothetical protein n=1 Tax=Novosphingobium sp. Fuku2-ISO-50 TaxID=1739114 RepID=UPI00076C1B2B|nr:hypothetical protein [Novosphingobium sp. Fuku2-ISO-50]KUR74555.1 hypothetical protein AQZ50_17280 [Novosphingobium sp. Fuku2-ISO-50]